MQLCFSGKSSVAWSWSTWTQNPYSERQEQLGGRESHLEWEEGKQELLLGSRRRTGPDSWSWHTWRNAPRNSTSASRRSQQDGPTQQDKHVALCAGEQRRRGQDAKSYPRNCRLFYSTTQSGWTNRMRTKRAALRPACVLKASWYDTPDVQCNTWGLWSCLDNISTSTDASLKVMINSDK